VERKKLFDRDVELQQFVMIRVSAFESLLRYRIELDA